MTDFGHKTTAAEVAERYAAEAAGKTVLITGANSGIGLETARVLAAHGASVVIACRSQANADQAIKTIKAENPSADVTSLLLDLSDLSNVRAAADTFIASGRPLHILINNAGIMACPLAYTKDGFESQFGVNHLGHFVLTNKLLSLLKANAPSRIVIVSSAAHYLFPAAEGILFDDLDAKKGYNPWERYGQSKLANILHAKELQRRLDSEGADVIAVSLHPGGIPSTNLSRHIGLSAVWNAFQYPRGFIFPFLDPLKSLGQGASTQVACALMPKDMLVKGGYYADCQPHTKYCTKYVADDAEIAGKLWKVSEELTKQ